MYSCIQRCSLQQQQQQLFRPHGIQEFGRGLALEGSLCLLFQQGVCHRASMQAVHTLLSGVAASFLNRDLASIPIELGQGPGHGMTSSCLTV
jgi:hypothetical protein